MASEDPVEEGGPDQAVLAWAAVAGGALLAGALILVFAVGPERVVTGLITVLVLLGGALLTRGLAGPLANVGSAVVRPAGRTGRLAAAGLRRSPRRAWSVAFTVAAAVTAVVTVDGVSRTYSRAVGVMLEPFDRIDLAVRTSSFASQQAEIRMPTSFGRRLARVPGVDRVTGLQVTFVTIDEDRVTLVGIGGPTERPHLALAPLHARRSVLRGTGAVLTRAFAERHGLETGDLLVLPTPHGRLQIGVSAVIELVSASDRGVVIVGLQRVREAFDRPGASEFELRLEPGADVGAVRARVEALVEDQPFPAYVATGPEIRQAAEGGFEAVTGVFSAVEVAAVAAAAISVVNALATSVAQRRREIGVLRAAGATRGQLSGIVMLEALGLAAVGAAVGLALGSVLLYSGVRDAADLAGIPLAYRFDPIPSLLGALAAAGVAVVGGAAAARRAVRIPVATAVGYE